MASRALTTPALPCPPAVARGVIEARVEQLISYLDMLDGDCDLEPEEDHDAGSEDEFQLHWIKTRLQPGDTALDIMPTLPVYGIDQTKGPTNENAAYKDLYRRMHEAA